MDLYTNFVDSLPLSHIRSESRLRAKSSYQRKAESLMGDDNCCKVIFKKDYTLTFELLDPEFEEPPDTNHQKSRNGRPTLRSTCSQPSEEAPAELRDLLATRTVFLKRSLRKCPQAMLGEEEQRLPNIETNGAIEFKMDKKSYRMIPLANSEDYLYHRHSLERAREVNLLVFKHKKAKFQEWLVSWSVDHLSSDDSSQCSNWFLGKGALFGNDTPVTECRQELCVGQTRNYYITPIPEPVQE